MIGKSPDVSNFNRLFLKLNQFICNHRRFSPSPHATVSKSKALVALGAPINILLHYPKGRFDSMLIQWPWRSPQFCWIQIEAIAISSYWRGVHYQSEDFCAHEMVIWVSHNYVWFWSLEWLSWFELAVWYVLKTMCVFFFIYPFLESPSYMPVKYERPCIMFQRPLIYVSTTDNCHPKITIVLNPSYNKWSHESFVPKVQSRWEIVWQARSCVCADSNFVFVRYVKVTDGTRIEFKKGDVLFQDNTKTSPAKKQPMHYSGTVGNHPCQQMVVQISRPPQVDNPCPFNS